MVENKVTKNLVCGFEMLDILDKMRSTVFTSVLLFVKRVCLGTILYSIWNTFVYFFDLKIVRTIGDTKKKPYINKESYQSFTHLNGARIKYAYC